LGLGSQPYVLFSSGSLIEGSCGCVVPVFLNIPAGILISGYVNGVLLVGYIQQRRVFMMG
jgi:hypothetical protein